MTRSTLTFDVQDQIKLLTPIVIKGSSSTSNQAIAQRLHPDNFQNTISAFIAMARAPFANDEFAADLAQLNVLSSIRRQTVAVYSSSFGDADLAELLVEAFNSTKDLAEIQGDERFSADIKPLHDRMKIEGAALNKVKDRLRARLRPNVIPLAKASDWMATVATILDAGSHKTKKDRASALAALLKSNGLSLKKDVPFDPDNVLQAFGSFSHAEIQTAAASFSIGNDIQDTDESVILARAGHLEVAIMWQQFINCLTRGSQSSSGIVDHRRSTELAASRIALVDFSINLGRVKREHGSYAMRGNNDSGAMGSTPWTAVEQTTGPVNAYGSSNHPRALLFHILSYAGLHLIADEDLADDAVDKAGPTAALITCSSAVPLSWHSLAPLFESRLNDLFKAFTPADVKFTSIDYLLELVSKRRGGLLSIAIERPKLERMLLDDIRAVISGVRESSQEGNDDRISDIVSEAAAKLYSYDVRCVTPFTEGLHTIETSVEDFITTGGVSMISTRPMGTFEIPKRYGRGFNEVVLRADHHAFDAIVDSSPLPDLATAYNSIVRLDAITSSSVGVLTSVNSWLSDALFDLSRNAVREASGQRRPQMMASETFTGAAFKPWTDYVVLKSSSEDLSVPLEAGIDRVRGNVDTWGNAHGSFTWGMLEGRHESFSTAYDRGVASSVVETLNQVVYSYAPRPVAVENTDGGGLTIALSSENRSYSSRLRRVDSSFVPATVDTGLILQLAATGSTDASIHKVIDGRLLRELNRSDLQVMATAVPVINFISDYAAEQLISSYSLQSVELMLASLTRPLTEAEHVTLRTPIFRATVKNMTAYIASTMENVSRLFGAVLMSSILSSLKKKVEDAKSQTTN